MKRKIFVFVGKPMTGKSTLAYFCHDESLTIVDCFCCEKKTCKALLSQIIENKNNYIIITLDENLNELTDRLKLLKADVSIVRFEQL